MKLQLIEFASIRFGVHAKALNKGPMALVPSSAIGEHRSIQLDELPRVSPEVLRFKKDDLLQQGDVLLIGKGSINHAVVWPGSAEDTLASNTLFVIRTDLQQVLPEYLAGYFNSTAAKAWFTFHQKAGTVKVLSRQALDEMVIPVPPIEVQHRMASLASASNRIIANLNELSHAHTSLLNSAWAQLDNA